MWSLLLHCSTALKESVKPISHLRVSTLHDSVLWSKLGQLTSTLSHKWDTDTLYQQWHTSLEAPSCDQDRTQPFVTEKFLPFGIKIAPPLPSSLFLALHCRRALIHLISWSSDKSLCVFIPLNNKSEFPMYYAHLRHTYFKLGICRCREEYVKTN